MDESQKLFFSALKFSIGIIVIIWIVHLLNYSKGMVFGSWGIFPREADGIKGILTSPFIHGSWEHLFSNSAPLLVTTTIIHYFYKRVAWVSIILIYVFTGIAVWLFGRSVFHIGASGVVYGLISFIFWTGVFRRNLKSIVLALVVLIMYSGYFGGIVPFKEGVSWESHLLGAIVGIIIAFVFKGVIESDENEEIVFEEEELEYFLPRDSFDMTKDERRAYWEAQQKLKDDPQGTQGLF